jgi:hypothetical protein
MAKNIYLTKNHGLNPLSFKVTIKLIWRKVQYRSKLYDASHL